MMKNMHCHYFDGLSKSQYLLAASPHYHFLEVGCVGFHTFLLPFQDCFNYPG